MSSKLFFLIFFLSSFSCASALSQEKPKSDEFSSIVAALEPSKHSPVMLELSSFDDAYITGLETKITELKQTDTEIYLRINSNGGSVQGMLNLIQFLEHQPLTCIVDTKAYSAAAYFTESPACKNRWATKRSTMLFHEALVQQADGNAHSLRDTANALEALTDSIIGPTAERMKMTEDEFKARINNCIWIISYKDMLKYHAIDKIVDPASLPEITPFKKPQTLFDLLNSSIPP